MTCRCRTPEEHTQRAVDQAAQARRYSDEARERELQRESTKTAERIRELQERSPDPDRFAIDDIEQVGDHLVVKVEYPGCLRCSYDRRKVMVFLNISVKDAIRWRRIDPHFRENSPTSIKPGDKPEAPSPAARFPASKEGWLHAIQYARSIDAWRRPEK